MSESSLDHHSVATNQGCPTIWLGSYSRDAPGCEDCACDMPPTCNISQHATVNAVLSKIEHKRVKSVSRNRELWIGRFEQYYVVFGPASPMLLVLTESAVAILQFVDVETPIEHIVKHFSEWPSEFVTEVVAILLAADALISTHFSPADLQQRPRTQLSAWIHLTNRCNMACRYCYVQHSNHSMNIETARRAIRLLYQAAYKHNYAEIYIKYGGGEPTLNFPVLAEAADSAHFYSQQTGIKHRTTLLTNGLNVKQSHLNYLANRDIAVGVSLDGIGSYHSVQRPTINDLHDSFLYVMSSINRFRQANIKIHVTVTITAHNLHGLKATIATLLEKHIPFSINFARPSEAGFPALQDVFPSPNEVIENLEPVFNWLMQDVPRQSLAASLCDRSSILRSHRYSCGAGRDYLSISPSGDIARCQMDLSAPVTSLDAEDPVLDIRLAAEEWNNVSVEHRECIDCFWRYRCSAGCPRLTGLSAAKSSGRSPLCNVYRYVLRRSLMLEAKRLVTYEKPWIFRESIPMEIRT